MKHLFVRVGCLAKYRNIFLQCEDEHQGSWHRIISVKCGCNECLLSNRYPPHDLERCRTGVIRFSLFVCLFVLP